MQHVRNNKQDVLDKNDALFHDDMEDVDEANGHLKIMK